METPFATDAVDDFAARVIRAWTDEAYHALRAELRAMPDQGLGLLKALADHSSEQVRVWAGGVAREGLGRGGIPILLKLASHRRTFTRDAALQDLEALDPELLRPFIPAMRRTLLRSTTLYSEGGAALWRLARLGDQGSAPTFRKFAEKIDPRRYYDQRMPLVLAEYLDAPGSIVRRIQAHDHEWMQWLAIAAVNLDVSAAREALAAGATAHPDQECRDICSKELRRLEGHRVTLGDAD